MPKLNGIEVAHRIGMELLGTGIVIISAFDDTEYILQPLKDGSEVRAYLLKTTIDDIDEVIRAVDAVSQGQTLLDPTLAQRLARVYSSQPGSPLAQLTEREREVLSLMAEGYTNAAIAEALGIEERTVENHTHSIYSTLNLTDSYGYHRRVQAVRAFVTNSASAF